MDADGLAAQRLGPGGERRRVGQAGGVRDILAQHQFDQGLVDEIGDRVETLALRRSAQEDRPGAHGEVGAAGDHRIDRAHAGDGAVADLEAFLPVEASVLGDERRAECERRCRQRHQDVDLLAHDRSGTKPDCDADGGSDDAVWHRVLPAEARRYSRRLAAFRHCRA